MASTAKIYCSPVLASRYPTVSCWQGHGPSEDIRGRSIIDLSPSFWKILVLMAVKLQFHIFCPGMHYSLAKQDSKAEGLERREEVCLNLPLTALACSSPMLDSGSLKRGHERLPGTDGEHGALPLCSPSDLT